MNRACVAFCVFASCSFSFSAAAQSWPDLRDRAPPGSDGVNDAAVVVGVSDYALLPDIAGAADNAAAWHDWLTSARGIRPENAVLLTDAQGVNWRIEKAIKAAEEKLGPGGTLWFVFVGHGAPSARGDDGVLLGADTENDADSFAARGLERARLLALLDEGRQARTVVVLDACFAGTTPDGKAIVENLMSVTPNIKKAAQKKKTTILSASPSFAGPLPAAKRPAFSYLLLGGLRGWADGDGDGSVSSHDAFSFTKDAMQRAFPGSDRLPRLDGEAAALATNAREPAPDIAALLLGRCPKDTTWSGRRCEQARLAQFACQPGTKCIGKPWFGVDFIDVTKELKRTLGTSVDGAYVAYVAVEGPAHFAGLQRGDVVTRLRGEPVLGGDALHEALLNSPPSAGVKIDVLRAGRTIEIIVTPADQSRRAPLLQASCDQNQAEACDTLGVLYVNGNAVAKDVPRAARLFERACTLGQSDGCRNLAIIYAFGKLGKRDPERAAALYQRACDAASAEACGDLGYMYQVGDGVKKDEKKAQTLYRQGCDGGSGNACTNLAGVLEARGEKEQAKQLYQEGCGLRYGLACRGVALQLENASDPPDTTAGIAWLERGCALKDGFSCGDLAARRVPFDEPLLARAHELLTPACDQDNDAYTCTHLGWLLTLGAKPDHARAHKLWTATCEGGDAYGCWNLAIQYRDGLGVAKDQKKAQKLLDQACKGGASGACPPVQ